MPYLSLQCPHCLTEKIGFAPRGAAQFRPGVTGSLVFVQCEGCGQAVVLVVTSGLNSVQAWMQGAANSPGPIASMYPKLETPDCPADVPDNVRSAYLTGLRNLGRPEDANAAAIMFRRAIELAVKAVNPNASKGDNLKKRIAELPPDFATPAMKDWAQHIRLDANDAAHGEDDYSQEDAKELRTFAEMFLTYAFTLPEMLKRAKQGPKAGG
jgi:Domain of unknown function (DUF4145)